MNTEELDPREILGSLGVADIRVIERVTGGWDTILWRVEAGTGVYALRVMRAEQMGASEREVAAMGAATAAGLPVPSVHAYTCWRDRPVMLLSWSAGRPLMNELGRRPWSAWVLGKAFGRVQARIHSLRAPAVVAQAKVSWIDWMGDREPALRKHLIALDTATDSLLHMDYHPLNVMVDGGQLTGILDWTNVRAGDARADVARTTAILRLAPSRDALWRPVELAVRRTLELGWRRGYQQVGGPLGDLASFYAWAGAVMAKDLAPKLGRPGVWLQHQDLERMRRWTVHWKGRAGIEDA